MILIAIIVSVILAAIVGGIWVWDSQRHKCFGQEQGRRYVPGIMERGGEAHGFAMENDYIIYGYTEITYKCNECGRYFNNKVVGKINT